MSARVGVFEALLIQSLEKIDSSRGPDVNSQLFSRIVALDTSIDELKSLQRFLQPVSFINRQTPEAIITLLSRRSAISAEVSQSVNNNQQKLFETSDLKVDLGGRAIRGGINTLNAQFVGLALNVFSMIVLARLLTPSDFGLVAMVTVASSFLAVFSGAGLAMATVQRSKITHEQVSTLFWLNFMLGLVFALVFFAVSPAIASFYGEPKLAMIAALVAFTFVLSGLSTQHQALLQRRMYFGSIAKIDVVSTAVGISFAILSAFLNAGYWALVFQILMHQAMRTGLTFFYCRWMPGLPRSGVGVPSMLRFGGYLSAYGVVNYISRNVDDVLVGKVWGSSELGIYSRAYALLMLPLQLINGPISALSAPALSRLQNDPDEFRHFFRNVLRVVCFLSFPLITWMILCRHEIVLLVLGAQWESTTTIFAILAFSAFFQPVGSLTGVLYIALGRTKRMFIWGMASSFVLVVLFCIAIPFGIRGVAVAYSFAIILMIVPLVRFAINGTPLLPEDFYLSIKNPAYACSVAALVELVVSYMLGASLSLVGQLILSTGIIFCIYTACSFGLDSRIWYDAYTLLRKGSVANHFPRNSDMEK